MDLSRIVRLPLLTIGIYAWTSPAAGQVLRPEKDFASTPEEMLEFFGRLKTQDKSYVVLPDSGHAIILEKGHRRFQEVVRGFFDRP